VTLELGFDAALALLVVAVAASMVFAREAFAAVVGFVAFGLLLTLAWVRLAAPDVALTEAAIGSGFGGGAFVVFGMAGRRGSAAGLAADPVPQALVITGIVVAFAATALAAALALRVAESADRETRPPTNPPAAGR
jgi:uncharacterized MnhB-related membrane protein